jgi:hypothetical protein
MTVVEWVVAIATAVVAVIFVITINGTFIVLPFTVPRRDHEALLAQMEARLAQMEANREASKEMHKKEMDDLRGYLKSTMERQVLLANEIGELATHIAN